MPAPVARVAQAPAWDYVVRAVGAPIQELEVEGHFAPGEGDGLSIDDEDVPFVRDVQLLEGGVPGGWRPLVADGTTWKAPSCRRGCTLRYRFELRRCAATLANPESASLWGDVVVATPSVWLLHPELPEARGHRFRVRVEVPAGVHFAAGTHPAPAATTSSIGPAPAATTFEADALDLDGASFAVFGDAHLASVQRPGARVDIAVAPDGELLSDAEIVAWVERAVGAIAGYYGGYRVPHTLVVVVAGRSGTVIRGKTLGDGGPAVLVGLPKFPDVSAARAAVATDWVLTHELLHVTLPALPPDQTWLAEGLPSYVEPFARACAGQLAPARLWRDLLEGLPQGLPQAGDEGLDRTHTWGRTYWGGALFALVADVTIRERTAGRRSLRDALQAVVATGATVEERWDAQRLVEVGDRATGTTVLAELYDRLARAPGTVDLPALWARLGVRPDPAGAAQAVFDEAAPLAEMRHAMTAVLPPQD